MNKRRVVVTGLGVLAPNGNSVSEYLNALVAGKSGIGPITYFDTENLSVKIAGELSDFNPEDHFDRKEVRKLDPFTTYALITAREAISQSRLGQNGVDMERVGVILGTGVGGIQTLEDQHGVFSSRGQRRVSPYFVPKMIANIVAGQVAIEHGFRGPNHIVISACASGTDGIGTAARTIQYGDADVVVTGGTEASITGLCIAGFANIKALSTRNDDPTAASRPFDLDRDGFVLGEGSACIILEEAEHAKSRGATILAELAGYGATDDAYHITQPAEGGEGAIRAMQNALKDAHLNIEDVDYINAHGTSTPFNDKTESAAIQSLFGKHAQKLKVSSTKSMTGHSLGASGALEAAACVLAIQHNMLPPTINYTTPDPECTLDYVPNIAQKTDVNVTMSNSFGFGGHNGVLVIKRWNE
ncbi:MAG: beta-ketoacyl-ACP synthase II [Candidatus Marinimicrobia bacterium]|jgi:3-oxoacyl-[acyl-carrier-protein] synthase II|nr:beta-ketoacyl-ACP synthase II [Candidatus Neomarinimicrobiota bacterium]MDP6611731.1 beta-ketoacyl-ACP synthase II [Candidatus Neomarinimicrobiota bacterium]|tara:strand:+ start:57343 stop:58587 length:1245 start_codon:yes stop_codon:yes gene_type:complete